LFGNYNNWVIRPFSSNEFAPKDLYVPPGETLVVLGYPQGYYDSIHNLPIALGVFLASDYRVPFEDKQYFLVNGNLQPGNSGSPVLNTSPNLRVVRGSTFIYLSPPLLLGIYSGPLRLPKEEECGKTYLNIVWFPRLIDEII